MAKPDLDDGWFMLAYELVAALMVAQIPKEARIVLFEVLSQVYGPAKLESARLSPTDIAARTGLAKPNVARGVAFLLKSGVLRREGMDAYFFVKDYESWGSPGDPLVPPNLTEYAAKVPKRLKSEGEFRGPKPGRKRVIETDNRSKPAVVDNPIATVDALSKNGNSVIETDNAHPISENREVVVVVDPEVPSATRLGTASDVAPASSPATSPIPRGHDGKPLLWSMYPRDHDPAEVDRIADLCANLAGPEEDTIPGNVRRNSRSYPLWYFPYAIRQSLGLGSPGKLWAYAFAVIKGLWAQGVIDEPQEVPRDRPRVTDPFIPRIAPRPAAPSRLSRGMAAFDDPRPDTKERA